MSELSHVDSTGAVHMVDVERMSTPMENEFLASMLAWERARAETTGARAFCARGEDGRPVSANLIDLARKAMDVPF